jgi:hypothetical protein
MNSSEQGAMKILKHMSHHKGVMDADTMDMPIADREKDAMKKDGK